MKYIIFFLSITTLAAHNHKEANLSIVIENQSILIQMEIPAIIIYGFEHQSKSKETTAKIDNANLKFIQNIESLISIKDCKLDKSSIDIKNSAKEKNHLDFLANIKTLSCTSISSLDLNFNSIYPQLENMKVQIIAPNLNKSTTIKKAKGTISLK